MNEVDCAWCGKACRNPQRDHVFPRSIGGTVSLSVPACPDCQKEISKAEIEFSRQSIYALLMAEPGAGPRGRHKRTRSSSGVIRARYILVRHPFGGYGESAFRAGEPPLSLPHIEIDPATLQGHVRGVNPSDIERLVAAFKKQVMGPPDASGMTGQIDVLTDDLHEIAADPDFRPRIALDLSGRLFIRARSPEEAMKFFQVLAAWNLAGGYQDHSRWQNAEIVGGTAHRVALQTDEYLVRRVFAKTACALAIVHLGSAHPGLQRVRDYVVGKMEDQWKEVVTEIHGPGSLKDWPEHHVAVVTQHAGKLLGILSLHGSCHTVDLGGAPPSLNPFPIAAMCRRDGRETRLVEGKEAQQLTNVLLSHSARPRA